MLDINKLMRLPLGDLTDEELARLQRSLRGKIDRRSGSIDRLMEDRYRLRRADASVSVEQAKRERVERSTTVSTVSTTGVGEWVD